MVKYKERDFQPTLVTDVWKLFVFRNEWCISTKIRVLVHRKVSWWSSIIWSWWLRTKTFGWPVVSTYMTGQSRLSEYSAICLGIFLFSGSFNALTIIKAPWLVIFYNIFQSIVYAFFLSSMD